MKPIKGMPPLSKSEIESLLGDTGEPIWRRTAIIATDDSQHFSGVFAKSFGYYGILTAGHSAEQFMEYDRVGLPVTKISHRMAIDTKDLEHVHIGYDESEGYSANQPDLSFVIIHNDEWVRFLENVGMGFWDLDYHNESIKDVFLNPDKPMTTFTWSVAGCPREKVEIKKAGNEQSRNIITSPSFLTQGGLVEYDLQDGFDYVQLYMESGMDEYPLSYDGMSGGGIWYQQILMSDDEKTFVIKPWLAGIARYQSEVMLKNGYKVRCITGHAWVSIYTYVRKALHDKRAADNR